MEVPIHEAECIASWMANYHRYVAASRTFRRAAAGLIAAEAGALCASLGEGKPTIPRALQGEDYIVAAPGVFEQLYELLRLERVE
jgi:hypothetical protein